MRIKKTSILAWLVAAILLVPGLAFAEDPADDGSIEDWPPSPGAPGTAPEQGPAPQEGVAPEQGNAEPQWGVVSEENENSAPPQENAPVESVPDEGGVAPGQEVDANYFFDALAPYGEWMWTPEYGWVWHPRGVPDDWRPYTNGRWMYTEYGWYWHSNYPWGWAPFHYGNWAHLHTVGWVWVPGTTWAPAWVMWRYSDDILGWSPIPPGYDWWYGWAYYPVYYDSWVFLNWRYFCDEHPYHHYLPAHQIRDAFRHTYFPARCRGNAGPSCGHGLSEHFVAKRMNAPIEHFKTTNIAGRNTDIHSMKGPLAIERNTVQVFQPKFKTSLTRMATPAMKPAGGSTQMRDFGQGANPSRRLPGAPTTMENVRGANSTGTLHPAPGQHIYPKPPVTRQPSMPRPSVRYPYSAPAGSRPSIAPPARSAPAHPSSSSSHSSSGSHSSGGSSSSGSHSSGGSSSSGSHSSGGGHHK